MLMYSLHGLEPLMRPDTGVVCQSLIVVSNCMPGSPHCHVASAISRSSSRPGSVSRTWPSVRAVRFHRIAPLAHVALRDVRPDLAALLREDRDHALTHHVRVTTSLAAISSTLADVPWLAFKGPVLSELLHPVAGLR